MIPAVEALVAERPERTDALRQQADASGAASTEQNRKLFATEYQPKLTDVPTRIAAMDAMGVDMQAVSMSPTQYYYWADRDLAHAIVNTANEHLAELSAAHPSRFVGLATVSLQHPELAAEQLTTAVKTLGLRGCQISTLDRTVSSSPIGATMRSGSAPRRSAQSCSCIRSAARLANA